MYWTGLMRRLPGRSDVHFWKHGRIGDSMVVTDEVGLMIVVLV